MPMMYSPFLHQHYYYYYIVNKILTGLIHQDSQGRNHDPRSVLAFQIKKKTYINNRFRKLQNLVMSVKLTWVSYPNHAAHIDSPST